MSRIDEDDLGEVENLSLFEKYPEAFKRLSVFFGIILTIAIVTSLILNRPAVADCDNGPVPVLHEEFCHADLFCIQELRSSQCVEFWAEKTPSAAHIGVQFAPHPRGLIGAVEPGFVVFRDATPRRLSFFEIPEGAEEDEWSLHMDVLPQIWGVPSEPLDQPYLMPLPPNRSYKVAQASDRVRDHEGMQQYAVDFEVSAGTSVRAMRDGFVVGMRMNSRAGGPRAEARGQANYIWIQHLDGTVATYRHLLRDSAKVELGDTVIAGQDIALAGSTGFVEGPTLHVHVSSPRADGNGFRTFPMEFQTTDGVTELETFKIYRPAL
ncbi:MAG: M23 family metallopeptidase [Pseudomonadota bacterium]